MLPFYYIFDEKYQEKNKNKKIRIFINNKLSYDGLFKNLDLKEYENCFIDKSDFIYKNYLMLELVK